MTRTLGTTLDLLGVCPVCYAVVPSNSHDEHSRWHKDRGEIAGLLWPLRDVLT
jgi:hypothetical protein